MKLFWVQNVKAEIEIFNKLLSMYNFIISLLCVFTLNDKLVIVTI